MTIQVSIIGASGYTGAELVRLLSCHAHVSLVGLFGHSSAGRKVAEVLPGIDAESLGIDRIESCDTAQIAGRSQVVFSALPHGKSQQTVRELRERGCVVFDLSADFRLASVTNYEAWYGAHDAPKQLDEAVYGLVELHREAIAKSDLIAVPGCYTTTAILALAPLLHSGIIEPEGIIVDAKSGATGAGRALSPGTAYVELNEGIRAYKTAGQHRHLAEIEEQLSRYTDTPIRVTFSPHLCPFSRGILALCYAKPKTADTSAQDLQNAATEFYASSQVVRVRDVGAHLDTRFVRGSVRVDLSYNIDRRTGTVVVQSALDNLSKGASAQAVQAFNVRFGFPELEALSLHALWP